MPVEQFKYSRVAPLEAGRNFVAEDLEIFKDVIILDGHMVPNKETFNLLWRSVTMFEVFGVSQVGDQV